MSRTITIPEDERTNQVLNIMNNLKFECYECGKNFRTGKAAESAYNNQGCPKCGGYDIGEV